MLIVHKYLVVNEDIHKLGYCDVAEPIYCIFLLIVMMVLK